MDIIIALQAYIGKEQLPPSIIIQDDGNGPYIKTWNYATLPQPTTEQLNAIYETALPQVTFLNAKNEITEAELTKQKENFSVLNNEYVLDCSDNMVDLLIKGREALKGTGTAALRIIDNNGKTGNFSLQDLDKLIGNDKPDYQTDPVIGEISLRRLELHNQTMAKIAHALNGEEFDLNYV